MSWEPWLACALAFVALAAIKDIWDSFWERPRSWGRIVTGVVMTALLVIVIVHLAGWL